MAQVLIYAAAALGLSYLLLILAFLIGLHRLHTGGNEVARTVAVVIPARNESHHIDACLAALAAQEYPADRMDVVVVDDRSTDGTADRARRWADRIPGLRVVAVDGERYRCPKKNALALGIRTARGDVVLTTDADCTPPPGWVASTVRSFEPDVGMVLGHAPLVPSGGLLQGLLGLQGLVVSALSAGSGGVGVPLTCSGRNLAYLRSAFEEVGGFDAIGHIVGGDDVLLMRRIVSRTRWRVRFNPDPGAAVPSAPHTTDLFRRQIRYQSKAIHYGTPVLIPALLLYIFHLILLTGPFIAWSYPVFGATAALLFGIKALADAMFLGSAARRLGARRWMRWFPVLELFSVPYVILFPALGVWSCFRGARGTCPHRWK